MREVRNALHLYKNTYEVLILSKDKKRFKYESKWEENG